MHEIITPCMRNVPMIDPEQLDTKALVVPHFSNAFSYTQVSFSCVNCTMSNDHPPLRYLSCVLSDLNVTDAAKRDTSGVEQLRLSPLVYYLVSK